MDLAGINWPLAILILSPLLLCVVALFVGILWKQSGDRKMWVDDRNARDREPG